MRARLRRIIAAAAPAALLAVPAVAAAQAPATYAVHSCRGPEGAPISTRAWQADPGDAGAADTCATGGALTATAAAAPAGPGSLSAMRFAAPAGAVIAGYRIHLTADTGPAYDPGSRVEAGIASGSVVGIPPVTAGCPDEDCSFGDEGDPLDDDNLVTSSGLPGAGLVFVARCTPGPCDDELAGGGSARARIWRSVVEIEDPAPPVLGALGGSLTVPGPVAGRASVEVPVSDAGGGVASVVLRVDGVERARVAAGGDCAAPYVVAAPCPATLPAALELDTAALAAGPHVAVVAASDAAGQTTTSAPFPFVVADPPAPVPTPASGPPAVVVAEPARAVITLDATRFTLPARGRRITGTVRRADGTPAAGAQLVVRARRYGADAPLASTETTVRTDAAGRFAIALGVLPRRLTLLLDDAGYRSAESAEVQVRGRLAIALRAIGRDLRNGSVLRLDARIVGAGAGAPDGRPVLVQAWVGGRWATVDSVEADAAGRARWRYRFRKTTRATLYRFRLRVPRGGADWPWPTTDSRVVGVLVRP